MSYWDEVSNSLLALERASNTLKAQHIIIYADQNISYRFIQRLRAEIGKVWSGFVHLKGEDFKGNKAISIYIAGSELQSNRKKHIGGYIYSNERIYTVAEKNGEQKIEVPLDFTFPIPAVWQNNISRDLYGLDSLRLMKTIKKIAYKGITIYGNDAFMHENKVYSFENKEVLESFIESCDLLLVKFSTQTETYGEYFDVLAKINAYRKVAPQTIHGVIKKPYVIDFSFEFESELGEVIPTFFD